MLATDCNSVLTNDTNETVALEPIEPIEPIKPMKQILEEKIFIRQTIDYILCRANGASNFALASCSCSSPEMTATAEDCRPP